jgi:aspartate-semialdehyde dehydrogenase
MGPTLAVVGATGAVGSVMIDIINSRPAVPWGEIRLIASARSAGKQLTVRDVQRVVIELTPEAFDGVEIAMFDVPDEVSRQWAPVAAQRGAVVVDNSAAFRLDPDVPLVVPEINAGDAAVRPKGIVANPNCTTMAAMPALKPLHKAAGLRRLVVSTYQAVSGAGGAGIDELESQMQSAGAGATALVHDGSAVDFGSGPKWARPIAYNVVPLNYRIVENGYSEEEVKLREETRKILEIPDLPVSGTCVRVPVWTGHSLSINAEFDRPLPVAKALELLREAPGVALSDVPNPLEATGRDEVFVGRVRPDPTVKHGLALFVTGDNLRKGAALNAVQIAEQLPARPPLRRKRVLETA